MKQRVTLELYQRLRSGSWRRIALLPDCDDEISDVIKSHYTEPKYRFRLITELF